MAIAGRVAIVPKGDWSANATYKRLDAVTYNNTLYFAKKEVPAGTATSNTEYWSKSIVGGASAIATTEDAGVVKPDGKSMSVDESGTLSINLDGTTITLDEAKNVIKLADTLKDAINGAFPAANVANNQITTVEGFALDARQANPNIDGSLAKQISDLNGSLTTEVNALNPSSARRSYVNDEIGKEGDGWYRFASITFGSEPSAKGGSSELIEVLINQSFTNSPGCFHKVDFYLKYVDSSTISTIGNNSTVLKKIRMVRNNKTIFIDVYSVGIVNKTKILLYIPCDFNMNSAECITPHLVPENPDGELIVCSSDLANGI
jgi:hypothetical protein